MPASLWSNRSPLCIVPANSRLSQRAGLAPFAVSARARTRGCERGRSICRSAEVSLWAKSGDTLGRRRRHGVKAGPPRFGLACAIPSNRGQAHYHVPRWTAPHPHHGESSLRTRAKSLSSRGSAGCTTDTPALPGATSADLHRAKVRDRTATRRVGQPSGSVICAPGMGLMSLPLPTRPARHPRPQPLLMKF